MVVRSDEKMTKNFDELNETFNTSGDIVHPEVVEKKIEKIKKSTDDIKKDYEYTRGNLYSLIEKGQEQLMVFLNLLKKVNMPRAYEVAGQLIKSVADATDKLLDLQKKLKDVEEDNPKGPTNVTNALFVGSTAELAKILKDKDKKMSGDLGEFFSLIGKAKQEKEDEFRSLVGDIDIDSIFKEAKKSVEEDKKKKIK